MKDRTEVQQIKRLIRLNDYAMVAAVVAIVLALFVLFAPAAGAHVPTVKVDCKTGLTVTLTNYEKGSTVTVNGLTTTFGTRDFLQKVDPQ